MNEPQWGRRWIISNDNGYVACFISRDDYAAQIRINAMTPDGFTASYTTRVGFDVAESMADDYKFLIADLPNPCAWDRFVNWH